MANLIPKRQRKPIFSDLFFVIAAGSVCAGVLLITLILHELRKDAELAYAELGAKLAKDTMPAEQRLHEKLSVFEGRAERAAAALGDRKDLLAFFAFLEETTHPEVAFSTMQGSADTGAFTLEGESRTFRSLEEQRLLWKGEERLSEFHIRNIALSESGGAAFEAELVVKPEMFASL